MYNTYMLYTALNIHDLVFYLDQTRQQTSLLRFWRRLCPEKCMQRTLYVDFICVYIQRQQVLWTIDNLHLHSMAPPTTRGTSHFQPKRTGALDCGRNCSTILYMCLLACFMFRFYACFSDSSVHDRKYWLTGGQTKKDCQTNKVGHFPRKTNETPSIHLSYTVDPDRYRISPDGATDWANNMRKMALFIDQ